MSSKAPAPVCRSDRSLGIDVARGLAVVLMIETHATDGWVRAADKGTSGYLATRVLSNIPAALFLLLAGVGLALGARRGAAARGPMARRALRVVGYGYLVSLVYAAIEGVFPPAELLRADILHCIGLSLLLCSFALLGRSRLLLRTAVLVGGALALGLALPRLVPPLPPLLAVPAALLYDVAPYTRFPLLPLCGYCAIGVWLGARLAAGIPPARRCLLLAAAAAALAWLFTWATTATVAALGGRLSRSHPAVLWNLLNGAARTAAVLLLSLALAELRGRWAGRALGALARLGRGSLLAYAFHIPLCYGRLSAPLSGRLTLPQALGALVGLILLTCGAVWTQDALRERLRDSRHPQGA